MYIYLEELDHQYINLLDISDFWANAHVNV